MNYYQAEIQSVLDAAAAKGHSSSDPKNKPLIIQVFTTDDEVVKTKHLSVPIHAVMTLSKALGDDYSPLPDHEMVELKEFLMTLSRSEESSAQNYFFGDTTPEAIARNKSRQERSLQMAEKLKRWSNSL